MTERNTSTKKERRKSDCKGTKVKEDKKKDLPNLKRSTADTETACETACADTFQPFSHLMSALWIKEAYSKCVMDL